ncbi:hypothetical protein JCM8547_009178 [Rhodosporidiobolus lusitaniae]
MTVLPSFPPLLGYTPREHLASGGQSTVYRALNPTSNHLAAIKIVPLHLSPSQQEQQAVQAKAKQLVREMRIHETLKHRNILRLFGGETREGCSVEMGERKSTMDWPPGLYMLLDLADGGDLFDKITPDVGVPEDIAHLYFKQLLSGLKYLLHHGICHRDLKPENCLLDGLGNLQISDFGLATVFKYKGQERLLKDRCGSPPYAAPELARAQPYAAEPIDVWSAGVVLFALLFGNTPWDEPTLSSPEFSAFLSSSQSSAFFSSSPIPSDAILPLPPHEPWNRLSAGSSAAQLLMRVLTVDPARRPRLSEVEKLDWVRQPNPLLSPETGLVADPPALINRLLTKLASHEYVGPPTSAFEELVVLTKEGNSVAMGEDPTELPSATQVAREQAFQERGLDPQQSFRSSLQLYSRLSMAPTQRTNPNLTRFFSTQPLPVLLSLLSRILASLSLAPFSANSGAAVELLYTPSGGEGGGGGGKQPNVEEIQQASLGTLFARFRIRTSDKRGQRLWVGIHVSKSLLPPLPSAGPSQANGSRRRRVPKASQGMDVDSASDSEEEEEEEEIDGVEHEEEKGEEGFDVVCMKRDADPLEMKRLWRKVVEGLPEGVVVAT